MQIITHGDVNKKKHRSEAGDEENSKNRKEGEHMGEGRKVRYARGAEVKGGTRQVGREVGGSYQSMGHREHRWYAYRFS